MAKVRPAGKGKSPRFAGLKQAAENHPVLVTVSALSLLVNAAVGVYEGYGKFFGEKPVLVEEYVDTSIQFAEHTGWGEAGGPRYTARLHPDGCRIADNDIRRAYWSLQSGQQARTAPLRFSATTLASSEDRVLYLVIHNRGDAVARDIHLTGERLSRPYQMETPLDSSVQQRAIPSLEGLVGEQGLRVHDDAPEGITLPLGSLSRDECLAVPVAVYQASPDEGDVLQRVSAPIYFLTRLEYRRAFGWITESQAIRLPSHTPLTVDPFTFDRG